MDKKMLYMPGVRCSSCGDGPYKEKIVEPEGSAGGILGGHWFCQWCLEYSFQDASEDEREQKLINRARDRSDSI